MSSNQDASSASGGSELTVLLRQWQSGDAQAAERVLLLTYSEMRKLAASYLRSENEGHTLQPTALVHELYVKLLSGEPVAINDRSHFMALCARQLRHILVDHARRKGSHRRGGNAILVSVNDWDAGGPPREESLLDLDQALTQLEAEDARCCKVVEMRFFGGLNEDEIAAALGISPATVRRDWSFARAWLISRLRSESRAN